VYDILDHLQTTYGRVSPQMLEDREQDLRTMTYNTQYPIDIVFNAVEDYLDFATLLGNQPLIERQVMTNKAYVIFNKARHFKTDITAWNRRPNIKKTWLQFKEDFHRAHQAFRETTDVSNITNFESEIMNKVFGLTNIKNQNQMERTMAQVP
jgi:hypothetical protein